ncbi:glycosyltransferase family 2 protein [Candidatus Falkowbacteria bacterium]|nr:MAG: glycosyltransferase family 2 protein [Candidatus Falkowbacteria bacterium]
MESKNKKKKKVFCVIPAFNEAGTIEKVIQDVKPYVEKIVVVDDASTDKTYDLAKKYNVAVLRHVINRDQGAALQTGNQYALKNGADIIVHFDADNQFVASEIKNVIEPIINNEADVVFGSRFLGIKSKIPFFKKNIIFPIARLVNKLFFGINLKDPQSGFRAMRREAAERIEIKQDGKAHCSEVLYKVFKNKFRIKEVPITVIYHDFGQKFSGGIKIVKDLLFSKLIN